MQTVTFDEAQRDLVKLARDLAHEGELVITDADKPVANLRAFPSVDDDLRGEL